MKKMIMTLALALFSVSAFAYSKLSDTGLFKDILKKEIATENRYYSPQYPLWTDGAKKKRWIFIPAGKQIDTSNMDRWVFPNGTKLWKEFAFEKADHTLKRVETRLIEKDQSGTWQYYTFEWNEAETEATRVSDRGHGDVYQINPTTTFDIPSKRQCIACHGMDNRAVQSFQAIQLSPVRDPKAPHQEAYHSGMLTLQEMVDEKLITHSPATWPSIPNDQLNPVQKTVFGYMVGNCSSCHRPGGLADRTGFLMNFRTDVKNFKDLPAYRTGIDQRTVFFQIPEVDPMDSYRLRPNVIEQSAVHYRLVNRNYRPMPPFGYKVVDQEGVGLIENYLRDFIK